MKEGCRRTQLASRGSYKVERCSCGPINLHVGAITLRFQRDALERLNSVIDEALRLDREMDEEVESPQLRLITTETLQQPSPAEPN